jgi:hypothetical protein
MERQRDSSTVKSTVLIRVENKICEVHAWETYVKTDPHNSFVYFEGPAG